MNATPDMAPMQYALRLAARHIGRTAPNPAVGCVIVKDGHIIGVGATGDGGRPHAETVALEMAGKEAQGADLYVTLEPCSHQGKTAPCSSAVIKAGIRRVICACMDPDNRVAGDGIKALIDADIEVATGICEQDAWKLNEGFFLHRTEKRPLVSLKIATSLDGKVATANGDSQWITGAAARRYGHKLRAEHDAILTGIGTVLADDPALTCRIDGLETYSPTRIVIDAKLQIPMDSQLVQTASQVPLWVITSDDAVTGHHAAELSALGATIIPCASNGDRINLNQAIATIAEHDVTRLLVEAGSSLTSAMLRDTLVDQLYWFRAPFALGNDGLAAIDQLPEQALSQIQRNPREYAISLGDDLCEVYRLRPCLPVLSPTLAA